MTKRQLRFFAKDLEDGKLGVKYSYHNFYVKLLRKLLDLGFIEKDVLIWDEKRKKTEAVYQLKLQPIPERGPQGGFQAGLAAGQGLERPGPSLTGYRPRYRCRYRWLGSGRQNLLCSLHTTETDKTGACVPIVRGDGDTAAALEAVGLTGARAGIEQINKRGSPCLVILHSALREIEVRWA